MLKEEIHTLLVGSGFCETVNKIMVGTNKIHIMYGCSAMKKVVEYYTDATGLIKAILGYHDTGLKIFENTEDFKIWLNL